MFSSSIKRSAATLGVVAGLLVAAGPASAQGGGADFTKFVVDGPITAKVEPRVTVDAGSGDDKVKAASGTQVGTEGVMASLGRENTIGCLLRAQASGTGQATKPAPLAITLCQEGFE